MSSTNGLKRISATSISNTGLIRLGNNLNPGTSGQVIKSNGDIDGATWEDETPSLNNYFKDNTTDKIYKLLRPLDFNMDNDSGGYNRLVIADTGQEGSVQNFGSNATQIYTFFEIPNGYKYTGYYINLTDSAGNPVGTTPKSNFFTQAGYKQITSFFTRIGSSGTNGYNTHIDISSFTITNGHTSNWVKGDPMYQGGIMLYKLYWSSAEYISGGYVEFTKI